MPSTSSFKLVLLGESAVGKSSIVLRFVRDEYSDYRESTIGAAFLTKTVALDDETNIKFEIWDTAGQERYRSLAPIYFRNSAAAIIVYDITQPPEASFEKAKSWVQTLHRQADPGITIILVGNKLDLVQADPSARKTSREAGERFARDAGLGFFETSARTGEGVGEVFMEIARRLPAAGVQEGGKRGVKIAAQTPAVSACQC